MPASIDYYLSLNSPWTYFGHNRLVALAQKHGASINIYPVNYGDVFPATGGLPLPKRAPERQAYRLQELDRWREYLEIPLNIHPEFYPADDKLAAQLVLAQRELDMDAAIALTGKVLQAVWADERNIADEQTLRTITGELQLDTEALFKACSQKDYLQVMKDDTQTAISRGVFGAPSYVIGDQLFWGQDRLDFVDRALAS